MNRWSDEDGATVELALVDPEGLVYPESFVAIVLSAPGVAWLSPSQAREVAARLLELADEAEE